MDRRRNGRHGLHASTKQKIKLISFMAKHPELITAKVTTTFSYIDRQRLWQAISDECNALPGAKKHWRQWRKTWQDLRSKYKKQYKGVIENKLPPLLAQLSAKEKEILGIKISAGASDMKEESETQKDTEFVQLEPEGTKENNLEFELEMAPTYSEPESPEPKVFSRPRKSKVKNRRSSTKHTDDCAFNCDLLAVNEQRKLEMKQDYINFKKDYLRQKLKLIKEQTEALKTIARELSDK